MEGWQSKVELKSCVIEKTQYVACAEINACLTIADCDIDCSSELLRNALHVEGKIKFVRNHLSDSTPRVIATDSMSNPPKHDVDDVVFTKYEFDEGPRYSDKEMSEFTKSAKQKLLLLGPEALWLDSNDKYKRCNKCYKMEGVSSLGPDLTEKFRYCSGCRAVAYCSKECQKAHWPDHRLTCRDQRVTAKTPSIE